ncbi:MAG: GNAT family N-acetyltransferase [bacterium]
MKFRSEIVATDLEFIKDILISTGFFYDFEIATAVEIGEEVLQKGEASGYHFLFVEDEDFKPYGFTSFGDIPCTRNRFDLYWIGVHEKMRGKGVGSILLKKSEKAVKMLSGKILYIETSAREQYVPTQKFYLKNGYVIETILKDFYDDGDGKVIYSKRLF